ncbi:prolyl oligopeptidase family serine peptidase [Corynebacterium freiburgense]|uniref:prolyl oligopeptidase family serine peptidase n=1 Tax=Corynebacterium freiburgense TaxID=556548 RepID=UPI000405D60B|nr:prolyl oligopeptidase family serine peptidase [Corynebacterium freiburgense]WJZ01507.1 Prolyl endopeptidase precursor [Corynebacterium freiburgense]
MTSSATPTPEILEEIENPNALAWAEQRSQETIHRLDVSPLRSALELRIREILDTDDRIPFPLRRGEKLFNFWRDAEHPKGLWRRCDAPSYIEGTPQWETLIDIDALAEQEDENWVWKGAHVLFPSFDRALVRLSRGGADASVLREFDLHTKTFVSENAFTIPEAKTDVSWIDRDTLLVSTDMGEGSLTESGYPARVYKWRRGQHLADAELFFAGVRNDVAVGGWADTTPGWERVFVQRALDFYRSRYFVETSNGLTPLDIPEDCQISVHNQWLFLWPREAFADIPSGGLGVIDFDAFIEGDRDFQVLFTPTPQRSLARLHFTRDFLLLCVLDNVSTQLMRLSLGDWASPPVALPLPEHSTVSILDTSPLRDNEIWFSTSSFIQPTTLLLGDAADFSTSRPVRQAPAQFQTKDMETRQYWARSNDGTLIPYFVTGRFSEKPVPTLVNAYGGFEVPLVPGYSAIRGIWMERGNLFVQANLRGGGEFGPSWHNTVVKTNREKIFEDHQAVIRDLVDRGFTTYKQIGIRGGSNGGLLSAVALTRYPEALGAVVSQVPLTDMLRFHTWLAGASWVAEYGHPEDKAERAVLESYSPLHHVTENTERHYPPALITTSTRDDRVHPAHARLFADALMRAGQPVDYFENTEGGHAGAATNEQTALMESIVCAWLVQNLEGEQ